MSEELIKDIHDQFGENATPSQVVKFLFQESIITPNSLRDYRCYKYIEKKKAEGHSTRSAICELEAEGRSGPASGACYSTIYNIFKSRD